jgi:hypothetical protein
MFHTWVTSWRALDVQMFDLKLLKHNPHAPNAVQVPNPHQISWRRTSLDARPRAAHIKAGRCSLSDFPHKGQKETFFIWTGDIDTELQTRLSTSTWQSGPHQPLGIASRPLHLNPSTHSSYPYAQTPNTHSSPLSAKMADNICSLSYKQRPLYIVPKVYIFLYLLHKTGPYRHEANPFI